MKINLSDFLSLTKSDFIKGIVMAVGGAVYGLISSSIEAGDFTLDWDAIWKASLAALVVYIGKQFFSPPPTTITVDTSKTEVIDKNTNKIIS